jgi:hypothetical protein
MSIITEEMRVRKKMCDYDSVNLLLEKNNDTWSKYFTFMK